MKKMLFLIAGLGLVVLIGVAACSNAKPVAGPVAGSSFDTTAVATAAVTPPAVVVPTTVPVVVAPVETMTVSQRAAVAKAESYIAYAGFSKKGLIHQLTSKAGEGFSKADAEFAVAHIEVDWNAEAAESAESYMRTMPMSKSALIHQLTSPAGEQFTQSEAEFGAKSVGL
jgi:hypothetical protein